MGVIRFCCGKRCRLDCCLSFREKQRESLCYFRGAKGDKGLSATETNSYHLIPRFRDFAPSRFRGYPDYDAKVSTPQPQSLTNGINNFDDWRELADRVLAGHRISPEEGLAVLRSADEELLDLLAAAYRVRYRWFGNRVDLNFLINAKSGLCSEDCGYCSQSRVSKAEIAHYPLVTAERCSTGRAQPPGARSKTYCLVVIRPCANRWRARYARPGRAGDQGRITG